ncbi:MAG: ABC transporter permease [Anaerolineae bacterium]|nr:ABC transporter permease [Anaerolineae bacterium]
MRTRWFWFVVQMTFLPLVFVVFLWLLLGRTNPEAMLYVITGNVTQSLATAGMLSLGQEIGSMKDYHTFDFFAALPVGKVAFVMATLVRSMLFTLPSALFVLIVGSLCFGLSFTFHPVLLLVVPLGGLALSGLGALVGFYSPNGRVAGLATQVLNPLIVFLTPVFVPRSALPPAIAIPSVLVPTTHFAEALRAGLRGVVDGQAWTALGILAGFSLLSLWIVSFKIEWRSRD